MHKVIQCIGVGLLVAGLSACDNSSDNTSIAIHRVVNNASIGQKVSLLAGKLSFMLPANLTDQSRKIGNQANNTYVYADDIGEKTVIVILGDNTNEALSVLTQRLADQQRTRDANLQVVTNKTIQLNGQSLQQLDSILSIGGEEIYSSIVMGKVDNHLMTLQITLPAENQQQAQLQAKAVIDTLILQ